MIPGTLWIVSWVGPREGLDVLKKRIISCPADNRTSDRPTRSIVNKPTDLSWILFFIRMPNFIILYSKDITFSIWKIWGKRVGNKRSWTTTVEKMTIWEADNTLRELFNYAFNSWNYITSVIDEFIEHAWNDNDYFERTVPLPLYWPQTSHRMAKDVTTVCLRWGPAY